MKAPFPEPLRAAHADAGVAVHVLGTFGYPAALAADHDAPEVLFSRGSLDALDGPRVTIVGTRRCTHTGSDVSRELGRDLSGAGVRVVSGLALGIDGAAHRGALEAGGAPPVAVVGSGLDVVYPARHTELWHQVAEAGLLLSEWPLGTRPEPWRFPSRNRILAALADIVVVVESPHRGGSRYTVDEAIARGRTVMAVPGTVRSPASEYPNALLADGCAPARDATDVLVALGLSGAVAKLPSRHRPTPEGVDGEVLAALGWSPSSLEQVVARTNRSFGEVTVSLSRLELARWVVGDGGLWEQVGSP